MFTDMAGYTALLQTDERLALDRRARYWDALERHHEAFEGTIVQRLGDGSMSMFPSSLAAVQAAVAGLAAAAAVDHRPDAAVRIAAAAEIYTGEEVIVNVYGDNPVGRELIDRARASLAAEAVIRATEAGRKLTIAETLEMARPGAPAPA